MQESVLGPLSLASSPSLYPALGEQGLRDAEELLRGVSTPTDEPRRVVAAFAVLFDRIFAELSLMFGERGVEALLRRALKLARRRATLLERVDNRNACICLDRLLEPGTSGDAHAGEVGRALADLLVTALDIAASLIGWSIVRATIQRLRPQLLVAAEEESESHGKEHAS